MKNAVSITLILGAVIGGLAGSIAGVLVQSSRGGSLARTADSSAAGLVPQTDELQQAGIEKLLEENRELRRRVADLELRANGDPRVPVAASVTMADLEALEERLRGSGAQAQALPQVDSDLKASVQRAMSELRTEERQKNERQRHEKQATYREDRLAKLSSRLNLSNMQLGEMRTIFELKEERDVALKVQWESGEGRDTIGETKRTNHEEYTSSLQRVLTPEQLLSFHSSGSGSGKN